jgi:hypothetical protein
MARNRIIYASQSVWANGEILYRVQSLGSTTTFTNEDIFELGHLDVIDVVDDVPAVAVTLNTNDFGDVRTLAILAQVPEAKAAMNTDATTASGNLVSGSTYLHGVGLADFAVTCGNLTGISMWAPVQSECDLGTLANNIDQTLFLDEVYINSLEFSYTTGANATENYGAETDIKMWLLNDGRFVTMDSYVTNGSIWTHESTGAVTAALTDFALSVASGTKIPMLSTGNYAALRKDSDGSPAVSYYDASANEMTNYAVKDAADVSLDLAADFSTDFTGTAPYTITLPTGLTPAVGDRIEVIYAADAYGSAASGQYFEWLDSTTGPTRPYELGAVRQGQVEIFIVDPDQAPVNDDDYDGAWRLTGVTISSDLTREPLSELGHLGPYDRPLTLPIPITVTVDTTAGDLEHWARFAGQGDEYANGTLDDIDLNDLMAKDNLILVAMIYEQTDEEAGGTGDGRTVNLDSMVGKTYFNNGVMGTYASTGVREYPVKTIVVKNLKITDEGMTLDVGANATQTFGFRSNNDLFCC